ncbi:MAG: M12 family metallopeptidase [Variovorax sp.]
MSRYEWPPAGTDARALEKALERDRFIARRRSSPDRVEPAAPATGAKGKTPIAPRAPASGLANLWQPLGPAAMLGGHATGKPRVTGRINALCVHPDGDRIYAASANGGVWYSANGGAAWESLGGTDATPIAGINGAVTRNACSAIAVAFGSGADPDVVYVGTGEVTHPYGVQARDWMSGQTGRPFGGIGILRGTHAAAAGSPVTWTREAGNLVGNGVYRIALEPGGTGAIAATLTGLWQRPAAGGDWVRTSGTPFDTLDVECTDVMWTAAAGPRPARLWAWVQSGANAGLWLRAIGQANFSRIETPGSRGRRAVLAASTPPDQVWVFADQPDDTTIGPTAAVGASAAARAAFSVALGHSTPEEDTCSEEPPAELRQGYIRLRGGRVIKPITYEAVNGKAYYQGCIHLGTVKQVEAFSAKVRKGLAAASIRPDAAHMAPPGVLRGVVRTGDEYRWPGGIVPWDSQADTRARLVGAIAHWEQKSRVTFVERTATNQALYPNYISVQVGTRCASDAGMQNSGQQVLELAAGCTVMSTVHELGHALGLWHEQSREDRDTYVRVQMENVIDGKGHNFDQEIDDGDDVGPYNYGSIMHYGRKDFSKNGQDTIVPLGGQAIGQRTSLSAGDVATINSIYPNMKRPLLFRVSAAGAATPVAQRVINLPDVLKQQGFDAIAMAVDPHTPDRVVLGGADMDTLTDSLVPVGGNAAIVWADVTAIPGALQFGTAPNAFNMNGIGVPPNVHDLQFSNNGDRLWAACDGGVFRSDLPSVAEGFYARNDGIGAAEVLQLGCHPTCEGRLVASVRGDVVAERQSNGVWTQLEGTGAGGIAFDPLFPRDYIVQRGPGRWATSDGQLTGDEWLTRGTALARTEQASSAPYSVPATIAKSRGTPAPAAPNVGQLLVGTKRLWYSENFGLSWVTLPTGTDPLPANLTQDDFEEPITVCAWQGSEVAWVLGERRVVRYARTAGTDATSGPGTWNSELILLRNIKPKKDATSAEGPIRKAGIWTDIAVNLDAPPAAGQPPAMHGTRGAVYLGTNGHPTDTDVDTLWWFDGTDTWFPTGLRAAVAGAPVTAIVCDPAFPLEVFVGTTIGVWKGTRAQAGDADPTWTWQARLNGLPEAPVQTLSLFSDGGLRLLRAGIAGRGVWEVRLDIADLQPLTYLRAHDDDLRHRASALALQRDGLTARSWHGSPDVRPRVAPAAIPVPASLPWTRISFILDTEELRRFQAAFRASTGDARIRATGEWSPYFEEVLSYHGAPEQAPGMVGIDAGFWTTHVTGAHALAEPWGTGVPSEADLHELTPSLSEGEATSTSCTLPPAPAKVDVVVHHRGLVPRPGADVRVTLLRRVDPDPNSPANWTDASTWGTATVPWTGAVNEVLNSAGGTTALTFGDGWSFVGTTDATRRLSLAGQTIDALHAGVATFDLDLTGVTANSVVLLVAVIRAGGDVTLAAGSLQALAMNNANVAVRSVRVHDA